jgi:predicted TIM-barrel fold metal-dependent hydrolase
MNDLDAALKETDWAISDLGFRGIQVYNPVDDKPLDSAEFVPFYGKMSQYNMALYIHALWSLDYPDHRTEEASRYRIYGVLGWPYETTVAMTRLGFSGIMERYPNLEVVTHHCVAMVPYFEQGIIGFYDLDEMQKS